MAVRILSFDFDGCLFNRDYIDNEEKNVIKSNELLLGNVRKKNDQYSKTIVFVGSNRQSKLIDLHNSPFKGSCFPAVKIIADYLNATLDTFLLADVYGELPSGTSFERALDEQEEKHADWLFDETKASILYAQMHKAANEHPKEQVVFEFYDDRLDILQSLEDFYSIHHVLIPSNVCLSLNHYDGNEVTQKINVYGSGFIDCNYRQTIKDMAAQAMVVEKCNGITSGLHIAHHVQPELLGNREPFITKGELLVATQVQLITDKALKLRKAGHTKAATKAEELAKTVKLAAADYFTAKSTPEEFRSAYEKAMKQARPELERHRGWTEFLGNLALILLGVVGFIIKGCVNLANNRPFLFFSKTDSANMVDRLEATLDEVSTNLLTPCSL